MSKYILFLGGICLFFAFTIFTPINLVSADLGRHLANGRLLLTNPELLTTNFFSYTYPHFSFYNHHWGFGFITFQVFKNFGFLGLSFFYVLLSLLSIVGVIYLALKKSTPIITLSLSLLLFPLWILRTEIRPEVISLFFSVLLCLLLDFSQKLSLKKFFIIPIIFTFWINCHVLFPLGFIILGYYWPVWILDNLKNSSAKLFEIIFLSREGRKWIFLFILSFLFLLINPIGFNLLKAPYLLSLNYGYQILENQNLWFLFQRNLWGEYVISWAIVFVFSIVLTVSLFLKKCLDKSTILSSLFLFFLWGLSFNTARAVTYASILALPLLAQLITQLRSKLHRYFLPIFFSITIAGTQLSFWNQHQFFSAIFYGNNFLSFQQKSIDFFKEQNLKGPIFNNYDIGGFLIFNLYPKEKVFVDNRPEAYPAEFFSNIYIPAQQDDLEWKKLDEQYQFNIIYFYRHDLTPWAQSFLRHRINDRANWAPIYIDNFVILFLKRQTSNLLIINKWELPQDIFYFR